MLPDNALCFSKAESISFSSKKYTSVTLREKQIDAAVWKVLSAPVIEHLNLCDCHILTWEGFRSCTVSAFCLDNVRGLSSFTKSAGVKNIKTLILSNCNDEMCMTLFPAIAKLHITYLKIRDADAMFLTHLSFSSTSTLKSISIARTKTHISAAIAYQLINKIAHLSLDEFGWLENGLNDLLIDVLEKTQDAPWNIRSLDFRNNNLSLEAFERMELFKQHVTNIQSIDISENNIPLHLSASLNTEVSEEQEESSTDEGMDVEEEIEEEVVENIVEEDDGETSARVLSTDEGRGKRERRDPVSRGKSMSLEAVTARYLRSIEKYPKVKRKRV